jgi:hypothetical protein
MLIKCSRIFLPLRERNHLSSDYAQRTRYPGLTYPTEFGCALNGPLLLVFKGNARAEAVKKKDER